MSASLFDIVTFTNEFLGIDKISDYCPNGLQVEGARSVTKIIGGVSASQALIDYAVSVNAQAILVHHGYFWKGEASPVVGIKKNRLKALLENDISLIAYHLPLDMHPDVGNNAQLANLLEFEILGPLDPKAKQSVGSIGKLKSPMTAVELQSVISRKLARQCQHIGEPGDTINTIAWCTGGAQSLIQVAADQDADAYISGEISEPTVLVARENGIHYYAAGHHATERGGVQALGEKLKSQFDIEFHFEDISNPA